MRSRTSRMPEHGPRAVSAGIDTLAARNGRPTGWHRRPRACAPAGHGSGPHRQRRSRTFPARFSSGSACGRRDEDGGRRHPHRPGALQIRDGVAPLRAAGRGWRQKIGRSPWQRLTARQPTPYAGRSSHIGELLHARHRHPAGPRLRNRRSVSKAELPCSAINHAGRSSHIGDQSGMRGKSCAASFWATCVEGSMRPAAVASIGSHWPSNSRANSSSDSRR